MTRFPSPVAARPSHPRVAAPPVSAWSIDFGQLPRTLRRAGVTYALAGPGRAPGQIVYDDAFGRADQPLLTYVGRVVEERAADVVLAVAATSAVGRVALRHEATDRPGRVAFGDTLLLRDLTDDPAHGPTAAYGWHLPADVLRRPRREPADDRFAPRAPADPAGRHLGRIVARTGPGTAVVEARDGARYPLPLREARGGGYPAPPVGLPVSFRLRVAANGTVLATDAVGEPEQVLRR